MALSLLSPGRVIQVYRKKWVIHVDRITREKANGGSVYIGIHPSKVEVTKLKMDKDRKKILDRKTKAKLSDKTKGKHKQEDIKPMET